MILTETPKDQIIKTTNTISGSLCNQIPQFVVSSISDITAPAQNTTKESFWPHSDFLERKTESEQPHSNFPVTNTTNTTGNENTIDNFKIPFSKNNQPTAPTNRLNIPASASNDRPGIFRYHSSPSLPSLSPTRHQFRIPNTTPRHIKETLNASLKVDETGKTINQYQVQHAVGHGSFGTVWLVVDTTTGENYAMKEYSKSMLRRKKQSEQMRQRRIKGSILQQSPSSILEENDMTNPINLIRREVAIMKKVDHPNVVTLIEVLDDPRGDSLYMILEWCEKGAIMAPDGIQAQYTEEECRVFFRDLILGIEYLHSQGIIHRDIKTENLLLDEDDVVKIADFGVSELLDPNNDRITKTAGSPAYMAPELAALSSNTDLKEHAVNKGINVFDLSGKSTDIWSMGVTLYQLLFQSLPFYSNSMVELFDKIVNQEVTLPDGINPNLKELFAKILAKRPQDRISMDILREHPWVTCAGADPLLSRDENTAATMTPVTEEDLHYAIELVEGLMEPADAIAKLRRLHGWHDYNEKSCDISPKIGSASTRSSSPASEKGSLHNLTRALQEVLTKSSQSKSKSALGSPLTKPIETRSSTANSLLKEQAYEEPDTINTHESLSRKPSRLRSRHQDILKLGSFRSKSLDPETRL